tara:strand:- start:1302 stop:1682 length:381 start_codon:yes stop_codon:yes gene_type:complete
MVFDGFVEVTSKGIRSSECSTCVAHGDEAVAVDQVNFTGHEGLCTLSHLPRHVRRVIIDHERIGVDAHSGKQTACLAVPSFDVRHVRDTASNHRGPLIDHPLKHEGMDAVVGPSMPNGESFHNKQR